MRPAHWEGKTGMPSWQGGGSAGASFYCVSRNSKIFYQSEILLSIRNKLLNTFCPNNGRETEISSGKKVMLG